ncbi:hypothetical protein [Asaia astilbis]|uniref:hypothetical protein n=1 Tax=Asaia astilbis TaxID=610244 RepID=UPI00046EB9E7|nr:hypothetical protein [Asaia astilbis]
MKNFGKWCAFGLMGSAAAVFWVSGWRMTQDGEWLDGTVAFAIAFGLWSLAYSIRPPREVVVIMRNCGTVDVHANGQVYRASGGEGV